MSLAALEKDLSRLPGVQADAREETLRRLSTDFGRIVHRRPLVVARPADTGGVAAVLRYANRSGLPLTARGAGHSQGGQCVNGGGILLDTRRLNHLEPTSPGSFKAGAGTLWRAVIADSLRSRHLPPVVVDNMTVTVGGVLSVGGVGSTSWLWGTAADHCLSLEVVTGEGEIVCCSQERNEELFRHVLCGLGQLAVITRAEGRLRRCRPHTLTFRLEYAEAGRCLADLARLDAEERADALEAWAGPATGGGDRRFLVLVTCETATRLGSAEVTRLAQRVLDGLSPDSLLSGYKASLARYVLRRPPAFPNGRRSGTEDQGEVRPWVELFLPWEGLEEALAKLLSRMGPVPILLWPIRRRRPALPLLRLPAERSVLVGSFNFISPEAQAEVLPALREASRLGLELGGRRYASGWLDFDLPQWRRHFGSSWDTLCRLKQRFDPAGILNPNLLGSSGGPGA